MWNRRKFLQHSTFGALGAGILPQWLNEGLGKKRPPLGLQLFTLPQKVAADFKGTLQLAQSIGYREIEFFGPYPFSAAATRDSWRSTAKMLKIEQDAFYGYSVAATATLLQDLGLHAPSLHTDLLTLRQNIGPLAEAAQALGAKYVVVPLLDAAERSSLDDYRRLAEAFNRFGETLAQSDLVFAYHNHGYEHTTKFGEMPLDLLLRETDPQTVAFELDVFWMTAAGANPLDYLQRYPRRFQLLHLKDAATPVRFAGDGGSPQEWFPLFGKMADLGTGVLDLPTIVAVAQKNGAKHFFLERDLSPTPEATLRNSYAFWTQRR